MLKPQISTPLYIKTRIYINMSGEILLRKGNRRWEERRWKVADKSRRKVVERVSIRNLFLKTYFILGT